MLFDSHLHLQDERIILEVDHLYADARQSGIRGWLCCGSLPSDWESVKVLSARLEGVIPAYGVHPWYVQECGEGWEKTLQTYLESESSCVGEIGLDHAIETRNDGLQEDFFRRQLTIAAQANRPVSIHCRKAWDDLIRILEEPSFRPLTKVLHSFSGSAEIVDQLAELGCYFSFSGSITRSNNKRGQKALLAVPINRLLIETDAPDLPPVIGQEVPSLNVPANLIHVHAAASKILGIRSGDLSEVLWKNSVEVFGFLMEQRKK